MGASHANNYAALGERVRVKTVCSRTPERAQRRRRHRRRGGLDRSRGDDRRSGGRRGRHLPADAHSIERRRSWRSIRRRPCSSRSRWRSRSRTARRSCEAGGARAVRTFMVGLVLRFWPEYVELHRRVAAGELGRPLSRGRVSPLAAGRLGRLVRGRRAVGRAGGRPDGARLRPGELAAREPRSVYARGVSVGRRRRIPDHVVAVDRLRRRAGGRGGEHGMPVSFPFSSLIRVNARGRRGRVRLPGGAGRGRRQHRRGRPQRARPAALPDAAATRRSCSWTRSTLGTRRSRSSCPASKRAASPRTAPASRRSGAARLAGGEPLARERRGRRPCEWPRLHERLFSRIDALHDGPVALIQELVRVELDHPDAARRRAGGRRRRRDARATRSCASATSRPAWRRTGWPRIRSAATSSASAAGAEAGARSSSTPTSTRSRRSSRTPGSAGSPWNPRGARRPPLRARLDGHEELGRRDVGGRPGAPRRGRRAGGGAAAALGRGRGDDGARRWGRARVVRAGFRADGAIVTEPTSFPRPLTVSTVAAGVWILRIVVEGKSTHCGNRPLAIRPGGPGDEIGVNALEKAIDVVEWLQRARGAVGDLQDATRASRPGSSRSARTSCTPTRGCPSPRTSRTGPRSSTYLVPAAGGGRGGGARDRGARARRLPARHRGCATTRRSSSGSTTGRPWRRRGSTTLVQAMARGHEAATRRAGRPAEPRAPGQLRRRQRRLVLRGGEGIPAVVYGPGDLKIAHCRDEHVVLDEVATAAKALAATVVDWCGTTP